MADLSLTNQIHTRESKRACACAFISRELYRSTSRTTNNLLSRALGDFKRNRSVGRTWFSFAFDVINMYLLTVVSFFRLFRLYYYVCIYFTIQFRNVKSSFGFCSYKDFQISRLSQGFSQDWYSNVFVVPSKLFQILNLPGKTW